MAGLQLGSSTTSATLAKKALFLRASATIAASNGSYDAPFHSLTESVGGAPLGPSAWAVTLLAERAMAKRQARTLTLTLMGAVAGVGRYGKTSTLCV